MILPGDHAVGPNGILRYGHHHELVQVGRLPAHPAVGFAGLRGVVVKAGEASEAVRLALHELERPGADVLFKLLLQVLGGDLLRHHDAFAHRQEQGQAAGAA